MERDSIPPLGAEPTRRRKEDMPIGGEGNEASAGKGKARALKDLNTVVTRWCRRKVQKKWENASEC